MHLEVIRVVVATTFVGVGDDHVRPDPSDDSDQSADGLVRICIGKGVRLGIGVAVGVVFGVVVVGGIRHAGVVITEHDDLVIPDDLGRAPKLPGAHLRKACMYLGTVHRRVQDVAGLTAGAADQDAVHTCSAACRDRRCPLGGLVVGMRMDGEQAEFRLFGRLHGRSR